MGREAHTAREKLEIRRKQVLSVQEPVDRWSSTETGTQEDPFSQLFACPGKFASKLDANC
ncbi:hypothetical protein RBSWK_00849 [Rhodopirellula baltica SWK14]|uniref:Uncharacterized protein n=1 Tax=Rhodopirellula baltica SWK14 TaxID=993516 RepID=L7CQ33_RHOBT|nr:hypothetical protein RBSWK_00849 [Rhodopirellula baltica SWK14]